jgi:hypothetical protein
MVTASRLPREADNVCGKLETITGEGVYPVYYVSYVRNYRRIRSPC